jgi:L-cystine transport system ATP-binding protein
LSLRDRFQREGKPAENHHEECQRAAVVKIKALAKSFAGHNLFNDLTLEFPRGTLTAIMGASGCGKSTLLRCINFLELFDSGTIAIGDLSVGWRNGEADRLPVDKKATVQKMRLKTGMVFQSFNLFPHLTVLENVTLAPIQVKKMNPHDAVLSGKKILERVGLAQKADVYPSKLSGGQQQRVAIARSLAMQPEVMLYDEPTSQLDPQLVDEVFAVMRELDSEGMTQIVVTHHEQFAKETACQVLRFTDGTFKWNI